MEKSFLGYLNQSLIGDYENAKIPRYPKWQHQQASDYDSDANSAKEPTKT
jgi:hypothetical protein